MHPLPINLEGSRTAKNWTLKILMGLTVIALVGCAAIIGWVILVRFQANSGVTWAEVHWREVLSKNQYIFLGGAALAGLTGAALYWIYKKVKRGVVREAKTELVRLLAEGKISREGAADELGVAKSELEDVLDDLKEKEVIE